MGHFNIKFDDNLTQSGACALAAKIRQYWRSRGYEVSVYVVQQELPRGQLPLYDIRSRMVGGKPQSHEFSPTLGIPA